MSTPPSTTGLKLSSIEFTERSESDNPLYAFNFGTISKLAFADLDNDSDADLLVGLVDGTLRYLENTGTANSPTFVVQTGSGNPFAAIAIGSNAAPHLVDIDNDNDVDLFIGSAGESPQFWENTGTPNAPTFVQRTGTANPLSTISSASSSSPTLVDLDGDGDFDLVSGTQGGLLSYFENTGNLSTPTFTERTGGDNPFTGIDVGFQSSPTFADIDGDGDFDLLVGEFDGILNYFENTGSSINPAFIERTGTANPFNNLDLGYSSTPAYVDIDGDADLDLFSGFSTGSFFYLENTSNTLRVSEDAADSVIDLTPFFEDVEDGASGLTYSVDVEQTDLVNATVTGTILTLDYLDNANGLTTVTITATDTDGNAVSSALNVVILPVNDVPTSTDSTVALEPGSPYTFSASDFGFDDPDRTDTFQKIQITTLPVEGNLTLNGNDVAPNAIIDVADLNNLVFTPTTGANSAPSVTFEFKVGDGTAFSDTTYTFTLEVGSIPDVLQVTPGAEGTYTEGQVLEFTVNFDETVMVDTANGTPTLPFTLGDGSTVEAVYVSGSGSSQLVFSYTVQTGDFDGDGIAFGNSLNLNGGTVKNSSGRDASLDLSGVEPLEGVLINTNGPKVTDIVVSPLALTNASEGIVSFDLTVTFDRVMDTEVSPLYSFLILGEDAGSSLSFYSGIWRNSQTYVATYAIADANIDLGATDVVVSGAQDSTNTLQPASNFSDSFNSLTGTAAANQLPGTPEGDEILGLEGDDEVFGKGGNDTILGGDGDDTLWGGKGADAILGNDGDDWVHGQRGNDTILGGEGLDFLKGSVGSDTVLGNEGNDVVKGGRGADMLYGNAGNDVVKGGRGSDTLVGTDETAIGLNEVDVLKGKQGKDTYIVGDGTTSYYAGGGEADFALIAGFQKKLDTLVLHGEAGDYFLEEVDLGDTIIGVGIFLAESADLVGVVKNKSLEKFSLANVTYVTFAEATAETILL